MPPLPPNVSKAGLLRGLGGWNNGSLSRRNGTTSGLLSTRTPQGVGTTGGGIPNPSLGIGTLREAVPKKATGSWKPRARPPDLSRSYITYQGQRTYIQPVNGVVTAAVMTAAYAAAGIDGNSDAHTLTFSSDAHTVGATPEILPSAGVTAIAFTTNRPGNLTIGNNAFAIYILNGNAVSNLETLTFSGRINGTLTIGVHAFQTFARTTGNATSALTTVTFPYYVGGDLILDDQSFDLGSDTGTVASALTTITYPTTVRGTLFIGFWALRGHSFVGAVGASKGVQFPNAIGSFSAAGPRFVNAVNTVQVNGSGAQLNAIDRTTTAADLEGNHYYIT